MVEIENIGCKSTIPRLTRLTQQRAIKSPRLALLLPILLASLSFSGCSHLGGEKKESSAPPESQAGKVFKQSPKNKVAEEETEVGQRPFEKSTLFDLMSAEMAAKDARLDITLGNYLKQAHYTKDPAVVARAMRIARYMKAHQATLDAARLFLTIEPNNTEALQTATVELIRIGRFGEALEHIDSLLNQSAGINFDFFVNSTQALNEERRNEVLKGLSALLKKHPNHPQLWFTHALLEEQNGNLEAALKDIDQAIFIKKDYLSAIIFKANLLNSLDKGSESLELLKKTSKDFPENKRLRIIYAKHLIEQKKLSKAQREFESLVKKYPDDSDLLLSLALISWENKLEDKAIDYLQRLIKLGQKLNESHTYLGSIAAHREDYETALMQFRQVSVSPFFAEAQIKIAKIQVKQDQLDSAISTLENARELAPHDAIELYITQSELMAEAKQVQAAVDLLTHALEKHPNHPSLLYTRALTSEKLGKLDQLEKDLRTIIDADPTSAMALNALGYTLADKTDRLDEAYNLVQRAIAIEPNDPAIIDSLGWIYFKKKEYQKAVHLLQKAHKIFPDGEIAAHLGEVYWVLGKTSHALKIWRSALKDHPDHPIVTSTMERLGASFR